MGSLLERGLTRKRSTREKRLTGYLTLGGSTAHSRAGFRNVKTSAQITDLLAAWRKGDESALNRIVPWSTTNCGGSTTRSMASPGWTPGREGSSSFDTLHGWVSRRRRRRWASRRPRPFDAHGARGADFLPGEAAMSSILAEHARGDARRCAARPGRP